VRSFLPVLLLGVAGLLLGGAISFYRQGASKLVVVGFGLAAVLAAAAGVFWLVSS
jgi:hypothetical protein